MMFGAKENQLIVDNNLGLSIAAVRFHNSLTPRGPCLSALILVKRSGEHPHGNHKGASTRKLHVELLKPRTRAKLWHPIVYLHTPHSQQHRYCGRESKRNSVQLHLRAEKELETNQHSANILTVRYKPRPPLMKSGV